MTTVTITQDMIDVGQRGECRACPVALGLLAAGFMNVSVTSYVFRWAKDNGPWRRLSMPDVAQDFIRNFDNGLAVQPFSFEVAVTP